MKPYELSIVTNGGHTGTLNMDTGIVTWTIDPPKERVDVGYLHLPKDETHTPEEIKKIQRIVIEYFAGVFKPKSSTPMKAAGRVARLWKPGEKEKKLREIRAQEVVPEDADLIDRMFKMTKEKKTRLLKETEESSTTSDWGTVEEFDLSLGATFQRYFKDQSWLEDAEKLKGGRIYLS